MAASPPPPTSIRRNPPRRGRPPPTPASLPPPTTIRRNPPRRARPPPTPIPTPARSAKPKPPLLSRLLDEAAAATADGISPLPPPPPTPLADAGISPIPPPPPPNPTATALSSSSQSAEERLKVYLRIRPLPAPERELCGKPGGRSKAKEQHARKPPRQDGDGICLVATGPNSVALTVPQSKLVDYKRGRTEVFDGFSAVLPPDSSQHDIFTQVMNPLVDDFLGGKSGLLVAMGPTGSGKTHTVFGTTRHPGIVPLTLQKMFNTADEINAGNQPTRSFFLSMFEILCEGKTERILDLLSDAADLVLQQSSIVKGLKEVAISNFKDAESLVSRGMLKRSTAATNANSESSRSQCIIIIRAIHKNNDLQSEHLISESVLTIADLAGAERKRSTGNVGSRLLESNFINNTSMVFGNCLRALLDHQKNQKKTLEKHFKNSMLTWYLRDYLEGRKRMTLILNVKPGDDDYSDTSYLLRQASPYMKIRYTSLDDSSDLAYQKRSSVSLICQENKKRRKVHKPEVLTAEGKGNVDKYDGTKLSEKDEFFNSELQRVSRSEHVMKNLFRALWAVSKQKLLESENSAKGMKELLSEKDIQIEELKKELNDLKSCSHEKFQVVEDTPFEQNDDCPSSSQEASSGNFRLGMLLGSVPKNPEELDSVSGRCEPTVEKISAEYGTVYRQLPDLKNDCKCVFPHALNERPSCLTESYQTLKDEVTDMTDTKESLSKEHQSLIEKYKALEDENVTVLAECMMLEHLSLFLRCHNDEVASALVSLTDEMALLSKGKLDREVKVLSARTMMLESENNNLKKHLVYLIEVLRTRLVLLEFESNTGKSVSQELAIELESLMAQLLQKDHELQEAKENVQLMQEKTRELCGVVGGLQVAIEDAKVVKGELEKKIVILTEEGTAKDDEIFLLRQANETVEEDACILQKKEQILSSAHALMSKEFEQHEREYALLVGDATTSCVNAAVYEEKALKFMMEGKATEISTIARKQMNASIGAVQEHPEEPESVSVGCELTVEKTVAEHDTVCGQHPDVTNGRGGMSPHVLNGRPPQIKASTAPTKDCREAKGTTDEKENYLAQVVADKKEDRQAEGITDKKEDFCASEPNKTKKSTRRLLPASAMMLKEFTGTDMDAATHTKRVADVAVKASGEAAAGGRSEKLIRLLKARPVTKHHHRS